MKKISLVKLNLVSCNANSNPPVGSCLGQFGVNINLFCKKYNEKTIKFKDMLIPVNIIIFDNKSFKIQFKTPPLSYFLSKYSSNYSINKFLLKKLVNLKKLWFFLLPKKKILSMIKGTLKSNNIILI